MPDLVPQVAEHGAVTLAHLLAHVLAEGEIRLLDVERDHSVVVAGHDRLAFGALEEANARPPSGSWSRPVTGSFERVQRVQQAAFRRLDASPRQRVRRIGQIGDDG
jgi:hypothetical protein